jgi:dipeptidyl aminopeptidase/acylaminoacyl peptidase
MSGRRRSTLIIGLLIGVIAVVAVGYLGAAVVVYDRVSRVDTDCGGRFRDNTPAAWSTMGASARSVAPAFDAARLFVSEYREVHIASRDPGIDLRAWWLPSREGPDAPTVIVVHGRDSCVREPEVLASAGMLHRLDYGVLLLDLRDHGASTIEDGRYAGGTEEFRDVLGAVDWLIAQSAEPGRIGVLGTSMGAATVIIAAGQDERIAAVWEDSGYADIETRIAEELEQQGYPRLLAPAANLAARIVSGDDFTSHTVLGEIANLSERHLFIAHGALDGRTYVSHADALAEAAESAGVRTDQWIVPEAGHVEAMFLHPEEYERRLDGFFGTAFGS